MEVLGRRPELAERGQPLDAAGSRRSLRRSRQRAQTNGSNELWPATSMRTRAYFFNSSTISRAAWRASSAAPRSKLMAPTRGWPPPP